MQETSARNGFNVCGFFLLFMEQCSISATALVFCTAQYTYFHFLMSSDFNYMGVHPFFIAFFKGEYVISASRKVQDSSLCHGKIRLD